MGADIFMMVEKKEEEAWCLVKNTSWKYNVIPLDRNSVMFAILSGFRNQNFEEIKPISHAKGLPTDMSKEVACWMEDLSHCSFLSLEEINSFDWTKECELFDEKGAYREFAKEFYEQVVLYLNNIKKSGTDEGDLRIVFGYSM